MKIELTQDIVCPEGMVCEAEIVEMNCVRFYVYLQPHQYKVEPEVEELE